MKVLMNRTKPSPNIVQSLAMQWM